MQLVATGREVGGAPAIPHQAAHIRAALGERGRVVGLDLLPMEPIPGATLLEGDFQDEAVEQAGALRFLPIVLTTLTAIGGLTPLARIASYATAGLDPAIMGTGPIPASRKALEKAGWSVQDLDLVEANEAFAAQACAVNKDMGWNPDIVNVNGGAIAIGHPIGASGARVLNTLLFEMARRDAKKGLATLCIGGGMGVALCVER